MLSAPEYPIPRPFIGSPFPNSEEGGTVDIWREFERNFGDPLANGRDKCFIDFKVVITLRDAEER